MSNGVPDPTVWRGRRVLLTGHTGFKGAWLQRLLERLGADVHGLALAPQDAEGAHPVLHGDVRPEEVVDLRDATAVDMRVSEVQPSLVMHLAAQALVPQSLRDPGGTWRTNVAGTLHLLEAVDRLPDVPPMVVTTTDKVYRNDESGRAFSEEDALGGSEPYSASKASTELLLHSWPRVAPLATARAGNVIGGGDMALDRLIPDAVRAFRRGVPLRVRNPDGVRPWQHVLEPIVGYVLLAEAALTRPSELPRAVNFGPGESGCAAVSDLLDLISQGPISGFRWQHEPADRIQESSLLRLNAGLAARALGWRPVLPLPEAVDWAMTWYQQVLLDRRTGSAVTDRQIDDYLGRLAAASD